MWSKCVAMGILISLAFSLVLCMAGDPFRVLTPGDPVGAGEGPFNAQWHNMATEAIRVSQRATPPGMTPDEVVKERDTDIWIANVSEEDIDEYRPVGLGVLAIYPANDGDFRERLCFLTDKLEAGRPFGIVQGPVGSGRLYVCKLTAGPGGQPPNKKWLRLVGEAEPWDPLETYALGEQVMFIGPTDPWTDGQGYVAGDIVGVDDVAYECVAPHAADPENAPPNDDFWEVYAGEHYIALVKHSGRQPPTNPTYWLLIEAHRGIWNRGDTYAPGEVVVDPQLGRVIIDGVTRAWLTVLQTAHQYARVDEDGLHSAQTGPVEVLWRQGGLGNQWAVVRLCCDVGLTPPVRTSDADMTLPPLECAGAGTFIFRPGGALLMGTMTCDGAGTHSYPARTGKRRADSWSDVGEWLDFGLRSVAIGPAVHGADDVCRHRHANWPAGRQWKSEHGQARPQRNRPRRCSRSVRFRCTFVGRTQRCVERRRLRQHRDVRGEDDQSVLRRIGRPMGV